MLSARGRGGEMKRLIWQQPLVWKSAFSGFIVDYGPVPISQLSLLHNLLILALSKRRGVCCVIYFWTLPHGALGFLRVSSRALQWVEWKDQQEQGVCFFVVVLQLFSIKTCLVQKNLITSRVPSSPIKVHCFVSRFFAFISLWEDNLVNTVER